jgi:hypothetical protein
VALAGTALRDPFQLFHGSDDGVAKEERELARQQFTNTVAGILGAKRFADYERAEDKHFQQLFEFGQENNLPKPTTVKVYEIQKLTEEEVERIRYDAGLDEAGRQRRFEEMEAAIQKEVLGAMGADAYSKYLNGGGHWVTNLNAL